MTRDATLEDRLQFLKRAENLKNTLRSGNTSIGRRESTAEHSWRLALLAMVVADLVPGIDLLKLLKLCILHDLGEAVDGDLPAPEQVGLRQKSGKERADFVSLTEDLPPPVKAEFLALWDEYENAASEEARLAKALDKIETLVQHNQGSNLPGVDYGFNLDYGRNYTDANRLTAELRAMIDIETRQLAEDK